MFSAYSMFSSIHLSWYVLGIQYVLLHTSQWVCSRHIPISVGMFSAYSMFSSIHLSGYVLGIPYVLLHTSLSAFSSDRHSEPCPYGPLGFLSYVLLHTSLYLGQNAFDIFYFHPLWTSNAFDSIYLFTLLKARMPLKFSI
jgi:hypothetical protein